MTTPRLEIPEFDVYEEQQFFRAVHQDDPELVVMAESFEDLKVLCARALRRGGLVDLAAFRDERPEDDRPSPFECLLPSGYYSSHGHGGTWNSGSGGDDHV